MKRIVYITCSALVLLALVSLFLYFDKAIGISSLSPVLASGTAVTQEAGIPKVVFKVNCYDEGKAALQGLKGIRKVETGFHYIHETDTVYYDPKVVTIGELESALKKAGTYVETIMEKERN